MAPLQENFQREEHIERPAVQTSDARYVKSPEPDTNGTRSMSDSQLQGLSDREKRLALSAALVRQQMAAGENLNRLSLKARE